MLLVVFKRSIIVDIALIMIGMDPRMKNITEKRKKIKFFKIIMVKAIKALKTHALVALTLARIDNLCPFESKWQKKIILL
jgi:hypothetical protein